MADKLDDPRLVDERKSPGRPGEQGLEANLIRRQRGAGVIPGHAVDPPRDRVGLVAAEHHAAGFRLAVYEIVRIAETRHIVRNLVAGHREQRRVLVIDGGRDDVCTCHGCDLRSPDAAGDDHHLGLNSTVIRVDSPHCTRVGKLDAGSPPVREDARAQLARGDGEGMRRGVRIQVSVSRHPDGSVERVGADHGHQARGLFRGDEVGVEANATRAAHPALQLHQLVLARCEAQAADGFEDAQLLVELDAVPAEPHHRR